MENPHLNSNIAHNTLVQNKFFIGMFHIIVDYKIGIGIGIEN